MKINLFELVIEVTRRCNMKCEHCLRGDAQNLDIDTTLIDKLLENVCFIGNITFSGGEPSLNVQAINYTLEKCKKLGVSVDSFYIVTNAKENVEELALSALRWFSYCSRYEREMCGLSVSIDDFHDPTSGNNIELLKGLSFYRDDKHTNFNQTLLLNEGRAKNLSGYDKIPVSTHAEDLEMELYEECNEMQVNSMIYLSANGDIKTCCDTSYDNDSYTIGNIRTQRLVDMLLERVEEKCA